MMKMMRRSRRLELTARAEVVSPARHRVRKDTERGRVVRGASLGLIVLTGVREGLQQSC